MLARINIKNFRTHECELKHLVAIRELAVEAIARIAREIADYGLSDDLETKLYLMGDLLGSIEENIQEFMNQFVFVDDSADAKNASFVRVDIKDFMRYMAIYGHLVSTEEHFADHIKQFVSKLQKAEGKEKEKWKETILAIAMFLDATRLTRQKFLNSPLEPKEKFAKKAIVYAGDKGKQ